MQLPPKQTRLWTFYAAISALVRSNPKNKHIKPLWDRLLNTVPLSTVWDPYVAKNIQQLEMIQRRVARWVLGRYDRLDSVTDMLSSLKWRSLELRRSDARLCMLYRQCNGLATYERDKLQREHKSRMDTRQLSLWHRFKEPRCTCDYYKNSFYPKTIAQWNNLPPEIVASTSPCSFRQSLCSLTYWLVILCYYCIHCCNFFIYLFIFYYLKQSAILCWEWRLNW